MLMMDQDVLTNGALGALWKQEQARRTGKSFSKPARTIRSSRPLSTPGCMVNCISPKSNESLNFPQLGMGQKRKSTWPQMQQNSSPSPVPRANKRTKFSLKEMADQFTASQVELAARSFMLPRASDQKSSCKHLPGISASINIFMNPESAVACTTQEPIKQESSLDDDFSWADPTPMRETTASSAGEPTPFAEPTPIEDPSLIAEPTPIWESLDIPLFQSQDTNANICAPFELDLPEKLQGQDLSSTPAIEEHSLLHQTIQLFPTNFDLVKNALELNQKDLRRKSPLSSSSKSKSYGYPLNIAILNDASFEVLELIAKAAPEVITHKDGCDDCGSLSLVLQRQMNKKFLQVLHLLIKANPVCLRMTDTSGNLPLHVALTDGTASLELVRVLCMLYPPALLQTNLKGETPLQIAQRTKGQDGVLKLVQHATKNQEQ